MFTKKIRSVQEINNSFTAELEARKAQQEKIVETQAQKRKALDAKYKAQVTEIAATSAVAEEEANAAAKSIQAFKQLFSGIS